MFPSHSVSFWLQDPLRDPSLHFKALVWGAPLPSLLSCPTEVPLLYSGLSSRALWEALGFWAV